MKRLKILFAFSILSFSSAVLSGPSWTTGKITSLMGSGTNPAIRLTNNVSPSNCNGGNYGWLYFRGSAQEKQWIYSTALAMSLSGKTVTVYTNSDGGTCKIHNIQITSGLN